MAQCKSPVVLEDGTRQRPCGQCMPCRVNKRREKTARLLLEAKAHTVSCFGTLTYDDAHLPLAIDALGAPSPTLRPRDLTLFHKRMRRRGLRYRYAVVGEYGERFGRPHYHPILYGLDPDTALAAARECWVAEGRGNVPLCEPERIQFRELDAAAAAYTAGYTVKKLTGWDDPGLLPAQHPERLWTSRMPGLGFDTFVDEIAPLLDCEQGHVKFYVTGEGITEIHLDGKFWPLDRYMQDLAREWMGWRPLRPSDGTTLSTAEQRLIAQLKGEKMERRARSTRFE